MTEKIARKTSTLEVAENRRLKEEVRKLKKVLEESKEIFRFQKIANNPKLVAHYTGRPDEDTFCALLKLFDHMEIKYDKGWIVKKLGREDQLFLTLIKLRRNLTNLDLGTRFQIDRGTVSNVFISWMFALHHVLVKNLMSTVPPREKNQPASMLSRLPLYTHGY